MKIVWTLIMSGALLLGVLYMARADEDTQNIGAWVSTQPKNQEVILPTDYRQVFKNQMEYIRKIEEITNRKTTFDPQKTQTLDDVKRAVEQSKN